jgi:nucleotide-binding universal stress UspA family protein
MQLRHIVVATDESDAARQAVRTALDLAERSSAQVTVLRVITARAMARLIQVAGGASPMQTEDDSPPLERLRGWLEGDVVSSDKAAAADLGIAYGVPGIEICRFAEEKQADLVVVGRKHHAQRARLLLGDTTDAVARRSHVPTLFVPPDGTEARSVLVALDGSDRGMTVLENACGFARALGSSLKVVTVERRLVDERSHSSSLLPGARTSALQKRVQEILTREGFPTAPVVVGRGDIVEEVLAAVAETESDVLAIGYHRGGPSEVIDAGSTAQRLGHAAPCAVLTIPL